MCSWIVGAEIGLDVLLWTCLGKFPGLVPASVGLSSSSRALTWGEGKILGERKRFGSVCQLKSTFKQRKGCEENP